MDHESYQQTRYVRDAMLPDFFSFVFGACGAYIATEQDRHGHPSLTPDSP